MLWEGKYYDTSLVYVYNPEASNTLKVLNNTHCAQITHFIFVCHVFFSVKAIGVVKAPKQNLAGPPGIVEFVKNVSYQNNLRMRKYEICRVAHTDQASVPTYGYNYGKYGGWTQRVPEDYLEINLTYPRYVTHIGTTGKLICSCFQQAFSFNVITRYRVITHYNSHIVDFCLPRSQVPTRRRQSSRPGASWARSASAGSEPTLPGRTTMKTAPTCSHPMVCRSM